ncbi:VOC family protein [Nocardioides gansuensis]|uniref:VOC family protein n=1 Tax=Nocardioides gansuensis TaxID=2138300 RepID=UPI001FEB9AE0|nr:VOC family protein [Nocardioides gansuensis]
MSRIRQLRLVVHASDYEQAVHFFRDVLGAPVAEEYASDGGAHVTILDVGRATLELANDAQVELIDRVEVGRRVAPHLRVALEVDDCEASTHDAVEGGAAQIAPPTRTPWDSLNSRLHAPAGIHLTLFQELGQPDG